MAKTKSTRAAAKKDSSKEKTTESDSHEEDDTEYEVQRILEVKNLKNGKREFLIKWKGFANKDTTWEPEENLSSCPEIVEEFLKKFQKDNRLSRSRRLTTVINTKSSKGQLHESSNRVKRGRIRKSPSRVTRSSSRSRTPILSNPVVSTLPANIFSPTKKGSQAIEEVKTSSSSLSKLNGELPLQKLLRESTEDKLKRITQSQDSTRGENKQKFTRGDEKSKSKVHAQRSVKTPYQKRAHHFGRFAKILTLGAFSSIGAYLLMNSTETLNWDNVSPHVQQFIKQLQGTYEQVRSKL